MHSLMEFLLFVLTASLMIMIPGPDFIYVTTRGISEGNKAGIVSALGLSVGLLVHTMLAAFGLSALIEASRTAYLLIKYVGAAYLTFLGVKMLLSNSSNQELTTRVAASRTNIFKQAILTNVFNPKVMLTFVAFLPQFVDSQASDPTLQFIFLGMTLCVLSTLWFSIVGYFAGKIGGFIKRNDFIQSYLSKVSGSIMILLGLKVALTRD